MTLIETKVLGAAAASIEFTSIPQTFTDLVVLASLKTTRPVEPNDGLLVKPNSTASGYTFRRLGGTGSTVFTSSGSTAQSALIAAAGVTADTFGNLSIYIPNYAGSTNKSWSGDSVYENNATVANQVIFANLLSNTAAITSLLFESDTSSNFISGSTISLYGITKGSDGIVTTS
jgi:hypothetical protein